MSDEAVDLTVQAAAKRDAGRGIARLPETARKRLGVLSGDTVVVEGDRATVAKVWPARDLADDELRVDADSRANAGAKIGDTVRVAPIDVADARSVTLRAPEAVQDADVDRETVVDAVSSDLLDRPVRAGEQVRVGRLSGAAFVVDGTDPDGTVRVTGDTDVSVRYDGGRVKDAVDRVTGRDDEESPPTHATYEDIGGLDEELDLVREMVELPLSRPDLFARLGVEPPKGVLLHGPPGTGKTLIARAVANEVDATFVTISGPEIMSKYKGESEERLRTLFEEAEDQAPAIVFFDEIDSIATARDDEGDVENRVVGQLLSLMDGLDARGDVIVIGATNRVDNLDPALRRGGRFDREIEIGVPGETGRREILAVHTRNMPLADDVDLERVAERTHGFTGADLESVAKEAAMSALRRVRREVDGDPSPEELEVTRADVESALAAVDPSAMREYVAETPTVDFDDVGGLDEAKATLSRAVTWPLTYGPLFDAADAAPPTGVLLWGPPGTGKTLLARAIAGESGVNFVQVAGPELLDRYVGESEKAVREVFERARQAAPAIVFFDEIDALAGGHGAGDSEVGQRVVSQLLTELDRARDNPNLVVLAATNRRQVIDRALLRPGRLEEHIEVPPPDDDARRKIIEVHTADKPLGDDVDLDDLSDDLAGYAGADVAAVCREAALAAVEDVADSYEGQVANEHADEMVLTAAHFDRAIRRVEPSIE